MKLYFTSCMTTTGDWDWQLSEYFVTGPLIAWWPWATTPLLGSSSVTDTAYVNLFSAALASVLCTCNNRCTRPRRVSIELRREGGAETSWLPLLSAPGRINKCPQASNTVRRLYLHLLSDQILECWQNCLNEDIAVHCMYHNKI